jgi:hypothetical protein
MKKILFVVAAAALTLASCGNKANAPVEAAVDSTEIVAEEANAAADEMVSNLTQSLDGKDVNALQAALEAAKAKVQELVAKNPEIAKEYLTKIQNFLTENAEKVKNLVGDNAVVNTAVAALTATSADDIVNKFVSDAAGVATGAADAANAAVEGAKDAANKAVEDAKAATVDKANEAVDNAKKEAGKQIDDAAAAAKKKLGL